MASKCSTDCMNTETLSLGKRSPSFLKTAFKTEPIRNDKLNIWILSRIYLEYIVITRYK
jgi:hypothetical protein